MKRVFLAVSLAMVLAAIWFFYPSHVHAGPPAPSGYALLTSRFTASGMGAKGLLTTTLPDGQVQTQDVEVKNITNAAVSSSLEQLHLNEVKRLNELRTAGWHVKAMSQTSWNSLFETVYLLEKE